MCGGGGLDTDITRWSPHFDVKFVKASLLFDGPFYSIFLLYVLFLTCLDLVGTTVIRVSKNAFNRPLASSVATNKMGYELLSHGYNSGDQLMIIIHLPIRKREKRQDLWIHIFLEKEEGPKLHFMACSVLFVSPCFCFCLPGIPVGLLVRKWGKRWDLWIRILFKHLIIEK